MGALFIASKCFQKMKSECLQPIQGERVGLILGAGINALDIAPLFNLNGARHRLSFKVAREDLDSKVARAQIAGLSVLGRYHTHLHAPAIPSKGDKQSLPPGWLEIILRISGPSSGRYISDMCVYDDAANAIGFHIETRAVAAE